MVVVVVSTNPFLFWRIIIMKVYHTKGMIRISFSSFENEYVSRIQQDHFTTDGFSCRRRRRWVLVVAMAVVVLEAGVAMAVEPRMVAATPSMTT